MQEARRLGKVRISMGSTCSLQFVRRSREKPRRGVGVRSACRGSAHVEDLFSDETARIALETRHRGAAPSPVRSRLFQPRPLAGEVVVGETDAIAVGEAHGSRSAERVVRVRGQRRPVEGARDNAAECIDVVVVLGGRGRARCRPRGTRDQS